MGPWTEQPRSRPSPAKALKAGGLALRKIADALAAAIVACSSGTSTKTAALPPGEHETDARRFRAPISVHHVEAFQPRQKWAEAMLFDLAEAYHIVVDDDD
jgi:hypothetical protein